MQHQIFFSHIDYSHGITAITAPMGEQIFLVKGEEKALVIDTGMGTGSLKQYLHSLTDLPLEVVNTHGHPDHGGGNAEFEQVWLHPADNAVYREMCSPLYRKDDLRKIHGKEMPVLEKHLLPFGENTRPLTVGQCFELGGRTLTVLPMPGHTPGSICLYDSSSETLFTGDSVGNHELWLHLESSLALQIYYEALCGLNERKLPLNQLFCGHRPEPLSPDLLSKTLACAHAILLQGQKGDAVTTFAGNGMLFGQNGVTILYNPNHLYDLSTLNP